jgi:hypothetical protein
LLLHEPKSLMLDYKHAKAIHSLNLYDTNDDDNDDEESGL